jgi:hypothetical protein
LKKLVVFWLLVIVGFDANCWKKVLSNINNAFLSKLYCFAKNFSIFVWFFSAKKEKLSASIQKKMTKNQFNSPG